MAPQDKLYAKNTEDKDLVERARRSNRLFALRRELGLGLVNQIEQIYREESQHIVRCGAYGFLIGLGAGFTGGLAFSYMTASRGVSRRDFINHSLFGAIVSGLSAVVGSVMGHGVGEGNAHSSLQVKLSALSQRHPEHQTLIFEYSRLAYPHLRPPSP